MSVAEEVKDLLKSTERNAELVRVRKWLEEKKAKGLIVPKAAAAPNLQDAERYSRSVLFGNKTP